MNEQSVTTSTVYEGSEYGDKGNVNEMSVAIKRM